MSCFVRVVTYFRALRVFTITGRLMQGLAALAFLGWLQGRDPDCVLETGVFLQLRMCGPEIAGEPVQTSRFLRLVIILVVFALGALLVRLNGRKQS